MSVYLKNPRGLFFNTHDVLGVLVPKNGRKPCGTSTNPIRVSDNDVKFPVKPRILHSGILFNVFRNIKLKALVNSIIKLLNEPVDTVASKKI
jgi:hypothetical protein